jgi:4-amino-4-deoxy-L-arabinose transferase-like glycosyltransferase
MKLALLQNSSIKKAPLRTLLSLSLAAAVLALALGFFLYNLQYQSISPNSDEVIHIRVTQEMFHSGMWWLPTHGGGPYFNKPPLKMWLSLLPLRIFGENNLSYRFVDICAGLGLLLATMVLGAKLYRSSLVGPIAALLLLACKPLVIGAHGIRSGTQDALLLFLLALAALSLWRIIAKANSGAVSFWALVMLGVLSGLAILVKSAAGVLPLLVAGPWLLARRETRGFRQLLAVGVPALLLPALYLLPHCLFTAGACRRFFVSEVLHRVTEGFHNRSDWSYYLRAIFRDGVIGTGLLASLAVGYALYRVDSPPRPASCVLAYLASCAPVGV